MSDVRTKELQAAAREKVDPQYDYTTAGAVEIAKEQLRLFDQRVLPVDQAFAEGTTQEERNRLLAAALEGIPAQVRITLLGLTSEQWAAVRAEASRVLDATESAELREPDGRGHPGPPDRPDGGRPRPTTSGRSPPRSSIPLIVANSFFSADLTDAARERAAAGVEPQTVQVELNEAIVRRGDKVTAEQLEAIDKYSLRDAKPDVARLGGWLFLSILVVALGLAWIWRFRRELWHRTNAMLLIALIVVGTAILLKATAGRPGLPFVVPTAAAGMLLAILLDAGVATLITIVIAVLGGAMADPATSSSTRPTSSSAASPGSSRSVAATGSRSSSRRASRSRSRTSSSSRRSRCSGCTTPRASSSSWPRRSRRRRARRSPRSARSPCSAACSGS